jgi:hypothetical protein
MKQIFGLYGTSNIGKSETIRNVYRKLIEEFPNFIFHKDYKSITNETGDISVVIIINGKIIGIESQGDPNSRIFISLPIFVKLNCDIILCATRTRGGTVHEVEKLQTTYDIKWIKKNRSENEKKYKADNDKISIEILSMISEKLK